MRVPARASASIVRPYAVANAREPRRGLVASELDRERAGGAARGETPPAARREPDALQRERERRERLAHSR